MPFDLAIFDYDGVLVDSLDEVVQAGNAFCRSVGHACNVSKKIVTNLHPMTYDQLARSIGLPPEKLALFSEYVFNRLQQADAAMPFYPNVKNLLRQRTPGNTAIISGNAREVIKAKLAAHALDGHVNCIFGAYQSGDKADKIEQACARFGVDPGCTCMIGDSVSDIQYAKKSGVQSIAVTWGWQSRETLAGENPDYIVESVAELAVMIK